MRDFENGRGMAVERDGIAPLDRWGEESTGFGRREVGVWFECSTLDLGRMGSASA
jgi:hypothetical protein